MSDEEEDLANRLLYAVKDVFPDKRGRLDAWIDAIEHVKKMHRILDEQHERIKVLEAETSGASTPIVPFRHG